MIVNEEFLGKLRQHFRLNLYEVKIWAALLSRGSSTAGELSEISDVPRSRTYDVLESLEKKGFIMMKLGKPIRYLAVQPDKVLGKAKKSAMQEAEKHVKRLDGLAGTDLLNELNLLYKQGIEYVEPSEFSGSVKGRHNAYLHMDSMMKDAKSSVCLVTSAKGLARKEEVFKQTFGELNKKGVKIRIAVPVTKESASSVKELAKFAEIRNLKKPQSRFCIVDDKELMFMLMSDKDVHANYDMGIWANTPFFAGSLSQLFGMAWKGMENAGKALKKI